MDISQINSDVIAEGVQKQQDRQNYGHLNNEQLPTR